MSGRIIELRSDTFTLPDEGMREAIARAELGDDVFGEDPSVNRLQEMAASLTGKEAALFVPSGSMANLVSLLSHCGRGDEIYLGDKSHIFLYEAGSSAAVGGLHPCTLPNREDGRIDLDKIEAALRSGDYHFPPSRLLCLETTHNACHGSPLETDYLDAAADLARGRDLKLHLDGARIFNASTALGKSVKRLARCCDSLSFCLSKGLGAPVGSLVCGDGDFIARARRMRKQLGGGMRQAGVLAAAGIYALENMVERLAQDHALAHRLALGLAKLPGLEIKPALVRSNIVYFATRDADATRLAAACRERGLRFLALDARSMRMVTHYGIETTDIDRALEILGEELGRL